MIFTCTSTSLIFLPFDSILSVSSSLLRKKKEERFSFLVRLEKTEVFSFPFFSTSPRKEIRDGRIL